MKEQVIELDCWPGDPRPGDLIEGVIKDTGLPLRNDVCRFFGCWTWNYDDIAEDVWKQARPILTKRITALYHRDLIRYGRW